MAYFGINSYLVVLYLKVLKNIQSGKYEKKIIPNDGQAFEPLKNSNFKFP